LSDTVVDDDERRMMTPTLRPTTLLLCALGADAATTYPFTYTDCGVNHTIAAAPTKVVTVTRWRE